LLSLLSYLKKQGETPGRRTKVNVDVPPAGLGRLFKVRFPDADHYNAAQAFETARSRVPVRSAKRNFISIELPPAVRGIPAVENTLDTQLQAFEEYFGATVVEDYRYDLEEGTRGIFDPANFGPETPDSPSLEDVLALIRAPEAWDDSNGGKGTAIAVVDTGVNGSRPEFPVGKQLGSWQPDGDTPWTDWEGHGTMCACIAAGTTVASGAFNSMVSLRTQVSSRARSISSIPKWLRCTITS
jgi:serine protease AprX